VKDPELLLQQKVRTLEEENSSLKVEAQELQTQTSEIEAHEKQLICEVSKQLG
jgi:FtsZ-binding cell division protein ZapB